MEVAVHHNDLRFAGLNTLHAVPPGASNLHGRLHCFSARIHRQYHVFVRQLCEGVHKRAELVVVKRAARQSDSIELGFRRRDEDLVAVTEVHRRVGCEAVEVTAAVDIRHPGALTVINHNLQRVVVVSGVLVLEIQKVLGGAGDRRS